MKRCTLKILCSLALLMFSGTAIAWVEHDCASEVTYVDNFMLVMPSGGDDTANVQCC